jgi:hypothetical protein
MSRNVTVTVNPAPTPNTNFPGQTWAGIVIGLTGQPSQTVTAAPYNAMFPAVPAGDVVATAQAVDTTGAAMGSAVSEPYTVVDIVPVVDVDIPATISFTLS